MRARLVGLLAAVAIAIAVASSQHVGGAVADPVCPMGSNWDNTIHACV